MKNIEEYKGIAIPIPETPAEVLIRMNMEKNLYKEFFKKNNFNGILYAQIWYEYDRRKAIGLGLDVSSFPAQLNYLENMN